MVDFLSLRTSGGRKVEDEREGEEGERMECRTQLMPDKLSLNSVCIPDS